ncbi:MAG: N-methyl-L-tryptophan oxidase [Chloroflexia bacterium]
MTPEVAVIGGGVMGLATAYSLLKRGVRGVVVLERDRVGNDRAASTDSSKAIRYEYAEDELYSHMVGRSLELWGDLERVSGRELYVKCGVVCWGRGEDSFAKRSYETLRRMGIPIQQFSPEELCSRFPQFGLADMTYATYNPEGGFLRASECVAALAHEVRRLGGEIREGSTVTNVRPEGSGHTLLLAGGGEFKAPRVVLAAGAWGAKLLPRLGLKVPMTAHKQQVVYMSGLGAEFQPGHFPVFLNLDHEFYGFPLDAAGLQKSSIHLPGPIIDPDLDLPTDPEFTETVLSLLEQYIPPAAKGKVALARTCMYAMTPDEDFIIDHVPGLANAVVAAGFSGHGFKFGPLIGEFLASLVLAEPPEFPLDKFAIIRFTGRNEH